MKGMALAITLLLFLLQTVLTWLEGITKLILIYYAQFPGRSRISKLTRSAAILSQVMGQVLCKLIHNISTNCRGMELNPITFSPMHA